MSDRGDLSALPARYDVYRVMAPGSRAEHWGLHETAIDGKAVAARVGEGWGVSEPILAEESVDWGKGLDVVGYRGHLVLLAGSPHPERWRLREANDWARAAGRRFRALHDAWYAGGMPGPRPTGAILKLVPRTVTACVYRYVSVDTAGITVLAGQAVDDRVPFVLVGPLTRVYMHDLALAGPLSAFYGAESRQGERRLLEREAPGEGAQPWLSSDDQLSEVLHHWTRSAKSAIEVIQALRSACVEALEIAVGARA